MNRTAQAPHETARSTVRRLVRRHGWAIQVVGGGACDVPGCDGGDVHQSFAYTIGLHGRGHAELLVCGLPRQAVLAVLNGLGARVRDGEVLRAGDVVTVEGWWQRFVVEDVPNPGEVLLAANRYYGRPARRSVAAVQLTGDDVFGQFPWDEGYASPFWHPRPGTFTA